jgi:Holliday junction resolvase
VKEKKLQTEVIKYLKHKGCYVAKMQPGPGVPIGTSDIFFCLEGFYGWLECKASKTAKFQPLQPEFLSKMDGWSWAKAVYPENWDKIKSELEVLLG